MKMIARVLNLIVLLLELQGLRLSISGRKWRILIFYTQLSNLLTTCASLLLVLFGSAPWVSVLRYVSVCMLVMTFLVTTCVLIPMGGDPKMLLWSGNGLYHHVLCPILSTVSYLLFESHASTAVVIAPVLVTLVYGLIMLWLNYERKVDGPYPFFRVRHQSVKATILWMIVLVAVISIIYSKLVPKNI